MLLELIGVSRADYSGVELPEFLRLHSDIMSAKEICGIPEELVRLYTNTRDQTYLYVDTFTYTQHHKYIHFIHTYIHTYIHA